MKTNAVLSAMGRDRIGLADDLAAALAERNIEIEDSRMTALKGQFAVMIHVKGESDELRRLERDLGSLGASLGSDLRLQTIETAALPVSSTQFLIESFSQGPSGIPAVTGVLKRYDINIEDLETEASASSWTSKMTFHMKARITLPQSCPVALVKKELRELERARSIDIVIEPLPSLTGA